MQRQLSLPRCSLRTFLVLITALVCIYVGGWEITSRWVVKDLMRDRSLHCETPLPYVAVIDEIDYRNYRILRRYHFVCLGLKARLPIARMFPDRIPIVLGGVIPRVIIQEEEESADTLR